MSLGSSKTTSMAAYNGLVHGLQEAKVSGYRYLYVVGDSTMIITQLRLQRCPRQPHIDTLYEKRGVLLMMLKSQTGLTSTVTSTLWQTLRQKLRWKPSNRIKITHPLIASSPEHCKHTSTTMSTTGLRHHTPTKSGKVPAARGPPADDIRQRIYHSEQASRLCEAANGC